MPESHKRLRKVALLTDGIYPYVIGGMQQHSYYLAKYFAQNNILVDLYHTQKEKKYDITKLEFFTEEERKNIRSFVIEFPADGIFPGHYIRNSYRYSAKIYELLKNNLDVDFIYAKGFSGWKLIQEKKKGLQCPPIGVKFHGLEMFQKPADFKDRVKQYFFHFPTLFNLKNADYVFSYGGKISEVLLSKKIDKNRIIEIPTGISRDWITSNIHKPGSTTKFLFIGRYERRKGIEELNKALNNIIEKLDFEFHFIGPIPPDKKIRSPKIKYWGLITDRSEMQKILHLTDVLVCPSHSEGMPNVILEGMASGLAVIATDVGAVRKMVSSENGWLINAAAVPEIERAISSAVKCDREKLEEKKKNSKIKVENAFLWQQIITQTISEIEKVI